MDIQINKTKAMIVFLGHRIVDTTIHIDDAKDVYDQSFNIDIEVSGSHSEYKNIGTKIALSIANKDKSIDIKIICIGKFEVTAPFKKDDFDRYNNACAAILFPYVRSYVSTLTAISNIPTITIPTVNLYES